MEFDFDEKEGFSFNINLEIKLENNIREDFELYLSIPTPKTTATLRKDEIPMTMMVVNSIQHQES